MEAINVVRRALNGMKSDEAVDKVLDLFAKTKTNVEFVQTLSLIHISRDYILGLQ